MWVFGSILGLSSSSCKTCTFCYRKGFLSSTSVNFLTVRHIFSSHRDGANSWANYILLRVSLPMLCVCIRCYTYTSTRVILANPPCLRLSRFFRTHNPINHFTGRLLSFYVLFILETKNNTTLITAIQFVTVKTLYSLLLTVSCKFRLSFQPRGLAVSRGSILFSCEFQDLVVARV